MKALIIEDDAGIAEFLRDHLPPNGFSVDVANDAAAGLKYFREGEYDIVLLDLNLPDMGGEEVCAHLRSAVRVPPILILTVTGAVEDKIRLLNAGADDYLLKPFSFGELLARMRALLRRSGEVILEEVYVDDLTLDSSRQTVRRGDNAIPLTRKEYALFEYLMRNRGSVVSKVRLIEHVWDSSANSLSDAIETHMTNLRKKIGKPDIIRTVHGRGYTIE
jgi:DNA-binding response OmpR family regulator